MKQTGIILQVTAQKMNAHNKTRVDIRLKGVITSPSFEQNAC
jgi:hypothetical protein